MKKNKIFAMMAAAMTFAACSTSDITSDYSFDDDKNTVTVSSVTRAGENQTTTTPTPVDMYESFLLTNLTQKDKARYNYEAVFDYDSNNNSWEPWEKVMWYGSRENVFQAFSPIPDVFNHNKASYTTFYIPDQDSESREAEADWMTATTTAKRSDNAGKLDLHFKHMLSKVTVKVTNSGTLDTKAFTLSEYHTPMIKSLFKYCKATYDDNGGFTLANYPGASGNDRWVKSKWVDAGTDNNGKAIKSISAIVACGDYTAQGFATDSVCRFTIKYDNEDAYEELAPVYIPTEDAHRILEAGKHYTYNVTLNNHNQAIISSVEVTEWEAGEIQNPQQPAEFIPYVTFTSNEEVGFKMEAVKGEESDFIISGLEYSVNNGDWKPIPSNGVSEGVSFGGGNGNLRLRGKNLYGTATYMGYAKISFTPANSDAKVACTGDIRTLLDYENYNTVETKDARFSHLFNYCKQLTSAPELPATTLANSCYSQMFEGCTSLETAPELPATTLADYCYYQMFNGCTSLETAPELPATTLANSCYSQMFEGCTSLETAPELPATTLANSCYSVMFNGCTSLTTAPELKATTLERNCYYRMFQGCTKLTTAPALPATTLADECYLGMFLGCTSLTTAPALKAETLEKSCYQSMFQGCTKLTTAPELKATTLASNCYSNMFEGCTKLTTAPELPATTLASNCYSGMFKGCTSLTQAPALPVETLEESCYSGMFYGCTSLTQAPALPATKLKKSCYSYMFKGCKNLNSVTMLATDVSKTNCLSDWLYDAGTEATTRTLKVAKKEAYNAIVEKSYLPTEWKAGTSGTTILDKDGNNITSSITLSSSN